MTETDESLSDNLVFLRGRLAAEAGIRTLPSGDELCSFRINVSRADTARSDSGVRVDSIDCSTVLARVRRCIERAEPGTELEVRGSLHRRFWRGPAGLGSRYEVAVISARATKRRRTAA